MSVPTANYQFRPPPIARGTNRVNTSRQTPGSTKSKATIRFTNSIPAGKSLQIPADGTMFYFRTSTGTLSVRPNGGAYSDYNQGEGLSLDLDNTFTLVDIKNNNAFAVVFEVVIGFQGFIDNKLILANTLYPSVAYPTYPTPNAATHVDITDLSGGAFTDINGGNWYALQREYMLISNVDSGVVLLVQKASSTTSSDLAISAVQPLQTHRLDLSGNYRLHLGGANINAIVSEVYNVIPAV
jgi:hypothetical protein